MRNKILSLVCAIFILAGSFIVPGTNLTPVIAHASDITSFMDGIEVSGSLGNATLEVGKMDDSTEEALDAHKLFLKYRKLAAFITGLMTATAMFCLFWNISKLATSLDNEFSRRRIMMGIATSAIGVALLGSATIILTFFYQFFN